MQEKQNSFNEFIFLTFVHIIHTIFNKALISYIAYIKDKQYNTAKYLCYNIF